MCRADDLLFMGVCGRDTSSHSHDRIYIIDLKCNCIVPFNWMHNNWINIPPRRSSDRDTDKFTGLLLINKDPYIFDFVGPKNISKNRPEMIWWNIRWRVYLVLVAICLQSVLIYGCSSVPSAFYVTHLVDRGSVNGGRQVPTKKFYF